jgi:WD40 repeat protein
VLYINACFTVLSGSSLAVLPIDDCGRKSKTMPLLHAHTDTVTDMDFSPFHDGLLATGSQDCLVSNYFFLHTLFLTIIGDM